MKKLFLLMIIAALFISCNTNGEHTTKYSNGNIDHYTYKDGVLTITLPNGDKSDGTIIINLDENTISQIYEFQYFKKWEKQNKKKTRLDGIVRFVKTTAIEAKYSKLKYPLTAKFNGEVALLHIGMDGDLVLSYLITASNAFGVPDNVLVLFSLPKDVVDISNINIQ